MVLPLLSVKLKLIALLAWAGEARAAMSAKQKGRSHFFKIDPFTGPEAGWSCRNNPWLVVKVQAPQEGRTLTGTGAVRHFVRDGAQEPMKYQDP